MSASANPGSVAVLFFLSLPVLRQRPAGNLSDDFNSLIPARIVGSEIPAA
ncbi:MAG: hypothetical protein LBT05_01205 [Planctomycetaceae bacterium]|nr:hypothetical protein [Planctomycetaceae bacterium]